MKWIGAALAALLVGGVAPMAQAATTIVQPDWIDKPTGEDMAEHFPMAAQMLNIEGRASISCSVNTEGRLTGCTVVEETPKDIGFGQAALAMSGSFRMRPQTVNGLPVANGTVRIPIVFRLPKREPSPPVPEPRSPEALALGRRLADDMGLVDWWTRAFNERVREIETTAEGSASGAARASAAGALRQAVEDHRVELRDAYARAFASVFSEDEMSASATFQESYGKLMQAPELLAAQAESLVDAVQSLRTVGHAAFCAKQDCGSPESLQKVWRPADPKENRIDNPQWANAPGPEDAQAVGPGVMGLLGVSGAVRLTCRVADDGGLRGCRAEEETPAKMGFGPAALSLTDGYRLGAIQLQAGGAGRAVTVRIGFPATDLRPPVKAPAAKPSTGALAVARQIITGFGFERTARLEAELQIASFESKRPPGADPKIYDDAIEAYRAGLDASIATTSQMLATAFAARFSEAQLTAMKSYFDSPAGVASQQRAEALDIAARNATVPVDEKIAAEARATYCAGHDCTPLQLPQPASPAKAEPSTRKP